MYTLSDETLDAIDAQMAEEELVAAVTPDPDFEEKFAAGELDLNDPYLAVRVYANKPEPDF